MENRNILKNVAEEDKNRESKNLSLLGLECILSHFDTRKRLELSLFYPGFRFLEKQCPLTLEFLSISTGQIQIDMEIYNFVLNNNNIQVLTNGVVQFVQKLFDGRTRFRVAILSLGFVLPFELSIDCHTVYVHSINSPAANYANVIRNVETLRISKLGSTDDLDYPWIQNVNTVEVLPKDLVHFLPALPNIPAKTIIVEFNFMIVHDLIRVWCESRHGRVGSRLFVVYTWTLQRKFSSSRLSRMGFIAESNERWRLPMDNNSEARLSIRDDHESFRRRFLYPSDVREYLCLEVVSL